MLNLKGSWFQVSCAWWIAESSGNKISWFWFWISCSFWASWSSSSFCSAVLAGKNWNLCSGKLSTISSWSTVLPTSGSIRNLGFGRKDPGLDWTWKDSGVDWRRLLSSGFTAGNIENTVGWTVSNLTALVVASTNDDLAGVFSLPRLKLILQIWRINFISAWPGKFQTLQLGIDRFLFKKKTIVSL